VQQVYAKVSLALFPGSVANKNKQSKRKEKNSIKIN
jgi:hypothetical protein